MSGLPKRPGLVWRVGEFLEAQDAWGNWTTAKLLAVNEDTKSVLVHYYKWSAKFDEEIEMSSDRLRPLSKSAKQAGGADSADAPVFKPGDLVLAKWRDTLWYQARVMDVDSKGHYSLFFTLDSWTAKGYRATQLKPYKAAEAEAIFAAQWPATGPSEINYDPMVRRIQENSRRRRLEKRGGGGGDEAADVDSADDKQLLNSTCPESLLSTRLSTRTTGSAKKSTKTPAASNKSAQLSQSFSSSASRGRGSRFRRAAAAAAAAASPSTTSKNERETEQTKQREEPQEQQQKQQLPPLKMTLKIPPALSQTSQQEPPPSTQLANSDEQQSEFSLTFEECREESPSFVSASAASSSRKRPLEELSPSSDTNLSAEDQQASTKPKSKRARLDEADGVDVKAEAEDSTQSENAVAEAGSSATPTRLTSAAAESAAEQAEAEQHSAASSEVLPPPPPPPPPPPSSHEDQQQQEQQPQEQEQRLPKMRVRLPKLSDSSLLDRSVSLGSPIDSARSSAATSTPGSAAVWSADKRRRSFFAHSNSISGSGSGKRKVSTEPTVPAHWTIETYECDQCGKSFRKEKLLADHVRFYHRPAGARTSTAAAAARNSAGSRASSPPTTSRRSEAATTVEDLESVMSSSQQQQQQQQQNDSDLVAGASLSKGRHKSSTSSLHSLAAAATSTTTAAPDRRRVIHCQCGRSNEDDMIQCEVCRAYQHARCASKAVDLRSIPDLYYVCHYCLHPRKEFKSSRRVWHHKWLRQPSSGVQTSPMMDVVRQVMELYAIVQKLKRFNTEIHSRLIKLAPELADKSPEEIRQLLQLHSQRQQQQQQQLATAAPQSAAAASSSSATAASVGGSSRARLDSVGELADFLPSLELDQLESLLGGGGVGESDEIGGVLSLPPPPPPPPPPPALLSSTPPPGADANELTVLLCTQQALSHLLSVVATRMAELRERPSVRPLAERTPRTLRPRLPALRNNLAKLRRLAALPRK